MSKLADLIDNAVADEGREELTQYLQHNDLLVDALKYAAQRAEQVADQVDTVETAVSDGAFGMAQKLMGQVRKAGGIFPADVIYFNTMGQQIAPHVLVGLLDILQAAEKSGVPA